MSHKRYLVTSGEKTYCDDAYCRGHTRSVAKCECGKVIDTYEGSSYDHQEEVWRKHIEHRLDEAGL